MSRNRPFDPKRGGVDLTAQHVNTGATAVATKWNRNRHMLGGNADKNCGLCTAAGVINLGMGQNVWTSGMVAEALNVADDKEAMGNDIDTQVKTIADFCRPFSRSSRATQLGSDKNYVTMLAAKEFMAQFPDGTVFAVYVCGAKEGKDTNLEGVVAYGKAASNKASHWLNAQKEDGKVGFVDFQGDHEERKKQAVFSDLPILAITGQTVRNPEMIVLAFSGTPNETASSAASAASAASTEVT